MKPTQAAGLQHVIQGLSSFWVERGCALLPPCSLEIPAALLHPKTFFRLLDPQPWHGVVAQPVSRPVDGRRGRHPFRTSIHLQLQVALQQPDPRAVRDGVVESLRHLGLDPSRHHLRLDSWRWQLDAVGAHGLGWRMTLDGIGIGRITFLDHLADVGLPQDRIDITYGVEHLALVLSGVDSVYRLPWQAEGGDALRYDQLRRTDEEEQSRYVEEVANVGHLRQVLDGLEREARRCLEAELARPAYERAIECLAVLDVLDVRRDLSDREREEWTAAVREVVAGAAELHLSRARRAESETAAAPSEAKTDAPNQAKTKQAKPQSSVETSQSEAALLPDQDAAPDDQLPPKRRPRRKSPNKKTPNQKAPRETTEAKKRTNRKDSQQEPDDG